MSSYAVYYVDDEEGSHAFVESFTDAKDAHDERDRLQHEIDEENAEADEPVNVRVVVVEEP